MLSLENRQKYHLKKKSANPPKGLKSPEATINEITETITTNENNTNSKEPIQEPTNEEYLTTLFKQYSDFTPSIPD